MYFQNALLYGYTVTQAISNSYRKQILPRKLNLSEFS